MFIKLFTYIYSNIIAYEWSLHIFSSIEPAFGIVLVGLHVFLDVL
jgi:hypothetical protein